jgi:hypothetical protein
MYFIKEGIVETWVMITTDGVQEEETKRISQPGETANVSAMGKPAPLKAEMPARMKTEHTATAAKSGGALTWEESR